MVRPHKGKQRPTVALASPLAREPLPAPLVYYPNRHGTFLAFAADRDEQPSLCACAKGAVRNLIRLGKLADGLADSDPVRLPPLDYGYFPDSIARTLVGQSDPMGLLHFRHGLCHRCNMEAPSLRYCREPEGTRFVQTYGWYINQTYLRLGIHPTSNRYLPEICPPEYHALLDRIQTLLAQARDIRALLAARMNGPRRSIPHGQQSHWPNVTLEELAPLEAVNLELNKPRYEMRNAVENVTRAEFGVRAIGNGWISETQLYQVVCRLFPGEQVLRHCRPEWLEGLELDIYLPGRRLGLEYQGQQHFHPIKAWGGEAALLQLQTRDARKAALCREAGVNLVIVAYTEALTEEHIRERLGPELEAIQPCLYGRTRCSPPSERKLGQEHQPDPKTRSGWCIEEMDPDGQCP